MIAACCQCHSAAVHTVQRYYCAPGQSGDEFTTGTQRIYTETEREKLWTESTIRPV